MTSDRLVYKTALSLVPIATSGLVRLVFSLLIGRMFDQSVLGHVNVIVSAAVFGTLLCSPGMGQSVARQMATRGLTITDPAGRHLLVRATALHHAACIAVAVIVGLLVPAEMGVEQALAMAVTVAYGCYTYYKAVLYGVDLVRRYAVLELVWDALFLGTLIAVVQIGAGSWLLAPMVVVYGGFSVGAHLAIFPRRRGRPNVDGAPAPSGSERVWFRAVGGYAVVTALGTASSTGFLQLSLIFARGAGGEHGAGLFAAALSLVTPAYLLPRAISVVLFPAMARAAGRADGERVRLQLRMGTHVLASALLPLFALASVLAPSVLTVAYGQGYADGARTLIIMIWATWVSMASVPAVNVLSSDTGRAYLVPAGASVAGFAVGMVWWIAIGDSIESVAWGYLIGSLVQSGVPMVEAARRHREPGSGASARMMIAAAMAVAASLLLGAVGFGVRLALAVAILAVAALVVLPELRALRQVAVRKSA